MGPQSYLAMSMPYLSKNGKNDLKGDSPIIRGATPTHYRSRGCFYSIFKGWSLVSFNKLGCH